MHPDKHSAHATPNQTAKLRKLILPKAVSVETPAVALRMMPSTGRSHLQLSRFHGFIPRPTPDFQSWNMAI
jgi:hypothetical protein